VEAFVGQYLPTTLSSLCLFTRHKTFLAVVYEPLGIRWLHISFVGSA
jgi:hypothetical protein